MNGQVQRIDAAIDSYADRAGSGGQGAAPYNSDSLAEIYAPRVRELLDLQNHGFEYAVWAWDNDAGCNRWHGLQLVPEFRNPTEGESNAL